MRDDLQLTPHCLDEAAQVGDVHVGAFLELGDGGLADVKRLSERFLGQLARLRAFAPSREPISSPLKKNAVLQPSI